MGCECENTAKYLWRLQYIQLNHHENSLCFVFTWHAHSDKFFPPVLYSNFKKSGETHKNEQQQFENLVSSFTFANQSLIKVKRKSLWHFECKTKAIQKSSFQV